jgi:biopolymer transport protein ExbD
MITRPLDLASRMRSPPRSLDWLYFVNAGLIALFFVLFGSRFVLAPGLGVDFRLPEVAGGNLHASPTTHVISVGHSGQILTNDGLRSLEELRTWLKEQARTVAEPSLLVRVDRDVTTAVFAEISGAAHAAGFSVMVAAGEPPVSASKRAP